MTKGKCFFRWYVLLTKRLLRRPAYLAVLFLIPLFALSLRFFSQSGDVALSVALVLEEPVSPSAEAAAMRLEERSLINAVRMDNAEHAREELKAGRVEAVWLLHSELEEQYVRFARRGRAEAVTVWQREENVLLSLAREKLFAALYPELSFALFEDYLDKELKAPLPESDELRRYYFSGTTDERILRFETPEGEEIDKDQPVLTAPLRGVLAVLLTLCGMASGLYCYADEREGRFVWLSVRARRYMPLLSHLTAMLPAALMVWLALLLSGTARNAPGELLLLLGYLPSAALFCELLRCLCPREEHYGALIPIWIAAMLLLCPVFLDLRLLMPLRELLPPTRYLAAVWSGVQRWKLLWYTAALLPPTALAMWLRQTKRGNG